MKPTRFALLVSCSSCLSVLSAGAATIVGGVDPATAPTMGFATDTADTFMVISNQFVHTTTVVEDIDLGNSTFSFQGNGNLGAAATPFLAVQGGGGIHDIGNYDVIWVGSGTTNPGSAVDIAVSLGTGTLSLPASSTIVAGYFGSAPGTLSPVSAVFGGGTADDVLVIAQTSVDVGTDLTLVGASDWSGNGAVTNRLYHYQVNLMPVPEPTSSVLLGLAGLTLLARRRR